jgi:hypothetical protein
VIDEYLGIIRISIESLSVTSLENIVQNAKTALKRSISELVKLSNQMPSHHANRKSA